MNAAANLPGEGVRVAVVGGGILGMTLALRLQRSGCRVTILEAAPEIGGLVGSHSRRWVHVGSLLPRDPPVRPSPARRCSQELGLSESLRWGTTRTGFYTDGELHSMSDSVEFLHIPGPQRWWTRLRLAATILYASRIRNWQPLEQIPVVDWLRRFSGRRTARENLAPPAQDQAGRELSDHQRLVHLGHHRADVRGEAVGDEAGDVRLRRGRVRHHPEPLSGRAGGPWHRGAVRPSRGDAYTTTARTWTSGSRAARR